MDELLGVVNLGYNIVLRRLSAVVCSLLTLAVLTDGLRAQTVAVLTSDSLISTSRTVSGARGMIRNKLPNTGFRHFLLSPDKPSYDRQVDSIREIRPDLILAVGSRATEIANAHFRETPIVFSSVLYPVLSGYVESLARPGRNITGASLNIPVDIQFRNFARIVPGLKNVGILYSSNTAALIPPSRVVARQLGLNLIAVEVNDQKMLPAAVDSLTTTCDGIWSVADPNLFSPQSTRFILLQAIRRGVPFMGFSRNVVESGALFALDFDYKAVGRQAGKTACRVLGGTDPGKIPVTSPDVIWFHYNERTAEHIKIKIPDDLIAIAKEVYR